MKYSLNDIERTLLSAYMDGELSPAETTQVEALLGRSDEARRYLDELRAVDHVSTETLGAAAGGSGVAIAMKLSGGAIEAAAKKALAAKAAATTTWGIAGTLAAVATVAVVVAVAVKSPQPFPIAAVSPGGSGAVLRPSSSTPVLLAGDIDMSNMIVPPMNTSDLMAFAVHGTLPLDAARRRFLTVAPRGNDSMAVEVHEGDLKEAHASMMQIVESATLDSLGRVLRTAVLHSKEGIVLRADLPELRLDVIRSLRRAAPSMPAAIRAELDRTHEELSAIARSQRNAGIDEDPNEDVELDAPVLYRMISLAPIGNAFNDQAPALPTMQVVIGGGNQTCVAVDRGTLRTLESNVRISIPALPSATAEADDDGEQILSNPAGVRVVRHNVPPPHAMRVQRLYPEEVVQQTADTGKESNSHLGSGTDVQTIVVRRHEEIRLQIDSSFDNVRQSLRTVDSLLDNVREQIHKRMQHGNSGGEQKTEGTVNGGVPPNN